MIQTVKHKDHHINRHVVDVDNYTRSKAIKAFCTECMGHEEHPKDCGAVTCPLYVFRGRSFVAWKNGRELKDGEQTGYAV